VIERGPERAVVRIRHTFHAPTRVGGPDSTIQQDITVYSGVPRVDVNTQVDWHEQHVLLKAGFPVNVHSDKAAFEIPYGTIERPTTRNTPEEQGMFEVPALRWGDISNASQGFSLLNASKYGYDAKDNVIRLSLLRSPQMPAPDNRIADQGFHEFTYSLYAHAGGWKAGHTMRQGYELNYPLIPVHLAGARRTLAGEAGLLADRCGQRGAHRPEEGGGRQRADLPLLRIRGQGGRCAHLQLPRKAATAVETDLMEKHGQPVTIAAVRPRTGDPHRAVPDQDRGGRVCRQPVRRRRAGRAAPMTISRVDQPKRLPKRRHAQARAACHRQDRIPSPCTGGSPKSRAGARGILFMLEPHRGL
jgi:alpha-mannosidase